MEKSTPICNAPFSQLMLSPTGKVHPCCYHFGVTLGSYKDSIDGIWNGPAIKKLRQEFLDGNPTACRSRIANLSCFRDYEHLNVHGVYEVHQKTPPNRIDVRLNGQCNLQCVMCDVWQQPNGVHNEGFIWKEGPTKIFPYLEEIDILGGEPFIQKDTFKLISQIRQVNEKCRFSFITNGQFRNPRHILSVLSDIPLKRIQVSIDAVSQQTFDSIRKGGDFSLLLNNFNLIRQLDTELIASFCVVRQNWREVPEFFHFCKVNNVKPLLQFAFYDPSGSASLGKGSHLELVEILETLEGASQEKSYQDFLAPLVTPLRRRIPKASESP